MHENLEKRRRDEGIRGYLLWGLVAVELLMSFSFLGYIHIEPISITLVYIPVLLAGCLMGPLEAVIVGAIFGLASMWKASAYYVSAGDMLFSPIMSGKPLESLILSVGSRMLFGLIVGLLYWVVKRCRHPLPGIVIVTSLGRNLQALCVYAAMGIFFPEAGYGIADSFDGFFTWESLMLLLLQDVVVITCYFIQRSERVRKFSERIRLADEAGIKVAGSRSRIAVVIALIFAASFSVAWYFTNRIESVMSWHGINVSDKISYDIVHLQIQFLLGIISLFAIVILLVVLWLKNFNYLYYEAELDGLTGLPRRRQFFSLAERMLGDIGSGAGERTGFFILIDVDKFKNINDRCGHPTGDRVLMEVSSALRRAIGDRGIIGRLGGDEFVALICGSVTREDVDEMLEKFSRKLADIDIPAGKVSCSIGVMPVEEGCGVDELYRRADMFMYEEKYNR